MSSVPCFFSWIFTPQHIRVFAICLNITCIHKAILMWQWCLPIGMSRPSSWRLPLQHQLSWRRLTCLHRHKTFGWCRCCGDDCINWRFLLGTECHDSLLGDPFFFWSGLLLRYGWFNLGALHIFIVWPYFHQYICQLIYHYQSHLHHF